ncbi:blue-light-activated protein [bacterium BMS3Abin07]|nr:blue-light-activated protein [bacterium BMS3Abin07]GBE32595.1 blue-light-activated protein [bacterium BMS3Bbin05]HDL21026.1 response regulator [Nitrospirota bacterium]
MNKFKKITNSLPVRIIIPVITIILLSGFGLYFFVLRSTSEFADRQIKESFSYMAHDIYRISDESLNELLQSGRAADDKVKRINKGLTIGMIEDYMRENKLKGSIIEGGKSVFSTGDFPPELLETEQNKIKENMVSDLWYEGKKYYVYHMDFQQWKWHILLIKDAAGYSVLINKVKSAYGATAFILLLSTFLIIYFLHRFIKMPIDSIISPLKEGKGPTYKGVYEFEYLSDNIRNIMDSLQRETKMLNNIYHIAASTRGEEFLDEVVSSITRMYHLNSLIARIDPDGETARVVTMYLNGELKKGITVSLKGTPCEDIVNKRHMAIIEEDVYKQFPSSDFLQSVKADAYIGFAIFDRKGDVIGIMNAFGKHRAFTESDIKVFQAIGQMVATELEVLDEERARENMREQLLQAQKMEAVGRLAGGVAHDFNNILCAIIGYSELAMRKMAKDNPLRKNIETIHKSANRAATLTQQLLAFSRKQIIKPEILNLNALIEDMMKMLRRLIGEDIKIEIFQGEGLWNIKADPVQIEQMVMNLAINARDAMPKGGTLTIETENAVLDAEYAKAHLAVKPGEYVRLMVSDTGEGMTDDVKRHIFDPFFTTKETGKGTGLGLATVYGIVKQNGGNIYVYSETGKGTIFKIYSPRAQETKTEFKSEELQVLPRGSETILLSEDEKEVREIATAFLSELGYTVLEAEDAEDALKMANRYHGRIHLLLTDVVMPGMSGNELAKEMRECCPEIKILYMSGYTENAIVKHGVLKNGINYLQKPFTVQELAQAIRRILESGKK